MTPISTPRAGFEAQADAGVVDSLLHPQAALIRSLLARSDGGRLLLIDDAENIVQALRAGIGLRAMFHSGEEACTPALRRELSPDVPRYRIARRTSKKLFGTDKVSRIFAIAERPPERSLDALLPVMRDIVVLDRLGIAGNIGAIIRTAAALGVGGIVLLDTETADVFDRRVIRASRGLVFALRSVTAGAESVVAFCRRHALPLLVTEPRADTSVGALASMSQPLAIVYGGEKSGCSATLREAATLRLGIPTTGAVESLNVAAAAAITLYCRYPFNAARAGRLRGRR